jgi:hypothetical protein
MRTRLLALAAGTLLSAGAVVLAPAAAQAAPASPAFPGIPTITVATLSTDSTFYTITDEVVAHATLRAPGSTVQGRWSLKEILPGGAVVALDTDALVNATVMATSEVIKTPLPGEYTLISTFTPSNSTIETPAVAQSTFSVRLGGVSVSEKHDPLIVGKAGSMAVTIQLPAGSQPVGGTVHLAIDMDSNVATCAPVRTSPTTAQCTLGVPATLTAGPHPSNINWEGSPTFIQGNLTQTLTVTAPKAAPAPAPKSNGGGAAATGGGPAPQAAPSAAPSVAASASATPSATRVAQPAQPGAQPAIDPSTVSTTGPIGYLPFLIAGMALLLVVAIVLSVLVVVRGRRAPTA